MEIKTVSLIGLGALGTLFGQHLAAHMPEENLRIIADKDRIARYRRDGIYSNGKRCTFRYISPEEGSEPADLLIFAVKFNDLNDAVAAAKNHIGKETVLMSLLNGISSEDIIGRAYGMEKLLYCVAQGMDAVKTGNRLTYQHMGMLCFGPKAPGVRSVKTEAVSRFFTETGIPHEVDLDMRKRLWGKFMFNVGVNQAVAVYESNYGLMQREGPARELMIGAMREVLTLSNKEGVGLTEADLQYWLKVMGTLSPEGKPSMRQDLEARRLSEVELFSGTVLALGKKHGLTFPVNQMLYDKIKAVESRY
ncbi:MAG: ketopantoate reductase family protein [Clostridia bacterium]|nr:ketopantoate reductase family protein [Clostridia bacterium]